MGAFQDRGFTITLSDTVVGPDEEYNVTAEVTSPYGDPVAGGVVTFSLSPQSYSGLTTVEASIGTNGDASTTVVCELAPDAVYFDLYASATGAVRSSLRLYNTGRWGL